MKKLKRLRIPKKQKIKILIQINNINKVRNYMSQRKTLKLDY